MAFYDNTLLLSNAQALTGAATAFVSTNSYDITGAGSGTAPAMVWGNTATATFLQADVMVGRQMYAYFTVTTAFSATTAMKFNIQAAPPATGNVPGTWVTIYTSGAFTGATDLALGSQLVVPIPPLGMIKAAESMPRFYQFLYVNTTAATFSAGKVTGGILLDVPTGMVSTLYPNNFVSGL